MPESKAQTVAWPRRLVRNTSVATRLSLVILLVALVSLVITSIVGLQRGAELADATYKARINSLGASGADEVERYVESLERAAIGQAISPSTAQTIGELADAYQELDAEEPSSDEETDVEAYYVDVVAPELAAVRNRPVNAAGLVPRNNAAISLQAAYVVTSADPGGLLTDAGDGSRWSELHSSLHESFEEFVIQTDVDDFYLIEPDGQTVVYSTAKDIDFATSLLTGPQSGSALAVLIRSFGDQPEAGSTAVLDFTSYASAGDEPSLFVASPVLDNGSLAGFVAIRIGPDKISAITTNNQTWPSDDETTETFVVAGDNLMRSDARGFVENEDAYLAAVVSAGTATESQAEAMQTFGTTVLFQPIDNTDVDAALDPEPSMAETTNFLGADVLQGRRALDIDGLDWAVITEIELQEIEQPVIDFARNLLIAVAIFLVAITFIAVRWTDRLLQPIRIISTNLRGIRSGNPTDEGESSAMLPAGTPTEFNDLAVDIDTMLETLESRDVAVRERAAERRQLLRRILPPQAAQRAEDGDRNVVDQVAHATVAVVVISGLGPLMHDRAGDDARVLLDRFVNETDVLARQRGLERVRLTGDAYFAACGTVHPHIDHVARSVSFVLDVRELVRDLGHDDHQITMAAGVDTGPVTVGLTGGSGLVYDAWGATVQGAADLARSAASNTVVISAIVAAQLPSTFVTEQAPGDDEAHRSVIVTGRVNDGELTR